MYVIDNFKIDKDKIINFTSGLPGFEDLKNYTILNIEDFEPFEVMYCTDSDYELKFVLLKPQLILPDYKVKLNAGDKIELGMEDSDTIVDYLIITVNNDDIKESTANMLGPIVINATKKIGKQLLLDESKFDSKFPIFKQGGK